MKILHNLFHYITCDGPWTKWVFKEYAEYGPPYSDAVNERFLIQERHCRSCGLIQILSTQVE